MNNITLMQTIEDLCTETNNSRERRIIVSTKLSLLRKSFGLKNDDHLKSKDDYERSPVWTKEEIRNEVLWYRKTYQLQKEKKLYDSLRETSLGLIATIEAIGMFDKKLALELKKDSQEIWSIEEAL
ncbi:hypothetical protein QK289_15835 [Exiguobacterium antarcticum]|uniref:Uncharacterized protein n=1 Tax=Exiguobacterium antarcticum TaxID=132920 RepID=A0ABT6R697_9BACL|nr:hypothetical protein [Exiguobacterium antarcticum]MDI3236483.1 hypothetical protein [Exiguobacterium antarcticum]